MKPSLVSAAAVATSRAPRHLVSQLFAWVFAALSVASISSLRADTLFATQTYTTPGSYTYTLPTGAYRVVVKTWGAGGDRSPDWNSSYGATGGGAGFVTATYALTAGNVLNLRVGSAPGAASAVWVSSGLQIIAAGGGSAGAFDEGEEAGGGAGGPGGPTGTGGNGGGNGGGGASGSAGGAGGTNGNSESGAAGAGPMNLNTGGSYTTNGGAGHEQGGGNGGSGYYGGGGGVRGDDNNAAGGGGGGSNYMDTANGYVTGSSVAGNQDTAGGAPTGGGYGGGGGDPGDPHYSTSLKYGQGANGSSSTPGNGAIVILVYAENQNPVASFTATPTSGRAPLAVSFNGSASSDPGYGGAITNYAWDYYNTGATDATGVTSSTTYQNTGSTALTLTPKLTVTDSDAGAVTANTTRTISVYPQGSYAVTIQQGSAPSGAVGYAMPSSPVSLTANTPLTTQHFVNWVIISGTGTFANANSASTNFTGTADGEVRATFGPTAPGSLASPSQSNSAINLGWTASVDDVAVTGYDIYRTWGGGSAVLIASVSGTTVAFTDSNVTTAIAYAYHVKARDGSGNVSDASNTVTVTIAALTDADGDGVPDAIEALFGVQSNANPSSESNLNLKVHRPAQ